MRLIFPLFLLTFAWAQAQTNATPAPAAAPAAPTPAQAKADEVARLMRAAQESLQAGKADEALTRLTDVLHADPQNIAAYVLRGQVYTQKKTWDKSENDFQAAHLIEPKNPIVNFDMAEVQFLQKKYDQARAGFAEIAADRKTEIGDLAAYKVFLCDLLSGHDAEAAKEFDDFNKIAANASYYYVNAAWNLSHHKPDEARSWLGSAANIYPARKNALYAKSLFDLGFLPLPAPPSR